MEPQGGDGFFVRWFTVELFAAGLALGAMLAAALILAGRL